jgi:hypothetical protein
MTDRDLEIFLSNLFKLGVSSYDTIQILKGGKISKEQIIRVLKEGFEHAKKEKE